MAPQTVSAHVLPPKNGRLQKRVPSFRRKVKFVHKIFAVLAMDGRLQKRRFTAGGTAPTDEDLFTALDSLGNFPALGSTELPPAPTQPQPPQAELDIWTSFYNRKMRKTIEAPLIESTEQLPVSAPTQAQPTGSCDWDFLPPAPAPSRPLPPLPPRPSHAELRRRSAQETFPRASPQPSRSLPPLPPRPASPLLRRSRVQVSRQPSPSPLLTVAEGSESELEGEVSLRGGGNFLSSSSFEGLDNMSDSYLSDHSHSSTLSSSLEEIPPFIVGEFLEDASVFRRDLLAFFHILVPEGHEDQDQDKEWPGAKLPSSTTLFPSPSLSSSTSSTPSEDDDIPNFDNDHSGLVYNPVLGYFEVSPPSIPLSTPPSTSPSSPRLRSIHTVRSQAERELAFAPRVSSRLRWAVVVEEPLRVRFTEHIS